MPSLTLDAIRKASGARLVQGPEQLELSGISTDTRSIQEGDLFLALSGPSFDGQAFAQQAVQAGARAVLLREGGTLPELPDQVALLTCANPRRALGEIGAAYRLRQDVHVLGITGSCGKTSTKQILLQLLEHSPLNVSASPASFNNDIGVPHTLLSCAPETDVLILEMGTNGKGEIANLCRLAHPTSAIVTNVGPSHLEGLDDEDGVALEKSALPASLNASGFCVLNAQCPRTARMRRLTRARVLTFGLGDVGDLVARDLVFHEGCSVFTLDGDAVRQPRQVRVPLLGHHQVQNVLAALCAGIGLGLELDELLAGLPQVTASPGRGVQHQVAGMRLIDETYNSNPSSMRAALRVLAGMDDCQRRVLVMGEMNELGEGSEGLHQEIGVDLADAGLSQVILVGPKVQATHQAALEAGMPKKAVLYFPDLESVRAALPAQLCPGDTVLLKGSRGARLDQLVTDLLSPQGAAQLAKA